MRKATGSYRTYSIPGKTSALVPKFEMEDLSSGELQQTPCGNCVGIMLINLSLRVPDIKITRSHIGGSRGPQVDTIRS